MALLGRRQRRVLRPLASGASRPAIAEELGLRRTTIDTYMRQILTALGAVERGQAILLARLHSLVTDEEITARRVSNTSTSVLTLRQGEVLVLLAKGRAYRQIAAELGVTLATARTHIAAVIKAMGAANRAQAVAYAAVDGLLDLPAIFASHPLCPANIRRAEPNSDEGKAR